VYLWLNKLYSKLIYTITKSIQTKNAVTIEILQGLISSLNPNLFTKYTKSNACTFKVVLVYPSIIEYTEKLNYINTLLLSNKAIDNDWCKYNYIDSNIFSFLTDKKNKSINNKLAIEKFKIALTTFNNEYIKSSTLDNFPNTSNTRILSKFKNHLKDVLQNLIDYSLIQ
jgi:hypothetical protein